MNSRIVNAMERADTFEEKLAIGSEMIKKPIENYCYEMMCVHKYLYELKSEYIYSGMGVPKYDSKYVKFEGEATNEYMNYYFDKFDKLDSAIRHDIEKSAELILKALHGHMATLTIDTEIREAFYPLPEECYEESDIAICILKAVLTEMIVEGGFHLLDVIDYRRDAVAIILTCEDEIFTATKKDTQTLWPGMRHLEIKGMKHGPQLSDWVPVQMNTHHLRA